MTKTFQEISAQDFDKFARQHELASMFQDSRWAKLKDDIWSAKYLGLVKGEKIQIASLVLVRRLPLGLNFWYLPRGPLFDPKQATDLKEFSLELRKFVRRHKAVLIKADPNILLKSETFAEASKHINETRQSKLVDDFKNAGWKHFGYNLAMGDTIQPRHSAVLYLDENWQNRATSKLRQYIRKAENMGIETETIGIDEISRFAKIMQKTAQDKGISLRNEAYFRKIKETFGDDCIVAISTIEASEWQKNSSDKLKQIAKNLQNPKLNQQQINDLKARRKSAEENLTLAQNALEQKQTKIDLACSLGLVAGDRLEMIYGGMDRAFSKLNASHVVDFWLIDWAQKQGLKTASIGGIEGDLSDKLSEFKRAFGCNVDEHIGEFSLYTFAGPSWIFDKVLPKIKHTLSKLRRKLRSKNS